MPGLEQRLYAATTTDPESVTDIWRRAERVPRWKSMTRAMRRARREAAVALEELADDGRVVKTEHELYTGQPAYSRPATDIDRFPPPGDSNYG